MILIKHISVLVAFVAAAAVLAGETSVPQELASLVAKARIKEPISIWCRAVFQTRTQNTFVVAAPHLNGGGRYLVLGLTETAVELASFSGGADLACYSLDEANKLNQSIARSKNRLPIRIRHEWQRTTVRSTTTANNVQRSRAAS